MWNGEKRRKKIKTDVIEEVSKKKSYMLNGT